MKEIHVNVSREDLAVLAPGRRSIRVGDLVRRVTGLVGLKACDGCKERRKSLNRFTIRW